MQTQFRIRARIMPTGQRMTALEGFRAMQARGGMPLHPLLDRHACDEDYRQSLPRDDRVTIDRAHSLLSGDLYAHAAKGGKFRRGEDIRGSMGLLPWSEIVEHAPPSEILRKKTGLLVTPKEIIDGRTGVPNIVVPQRIAIVHPVVETHGQKGRVDKKTGMVVEDSKYRLAKTPSNETRFLYVSELGDLASLARDVDVHGVCRRQYVDADHRVSDLFGVAYVVYDVLDEKGKVIATTDAAGLATMSAQLAPPTQTTI